MQELLREGRHESGKEENDEVAEAADFAEHHEYVINHAFLNVDLL